MKTQEQFKVNAVWFVIKQNTITGKLSANLPSANDTRTEKTITSHGNADDEEDKVARSLRLNL